MSAPDPAGIFESDLQRRLLGHLTTPSEKVGFPVENLTARFAEDHASDSLDQKEVEAELAKLQDEGLVTDHGAGVWQMTDAGLEKLTGPIANEPPPGATPEGPAQVGLGRAAQQPVPIPEVEVPE